MPNDNSTQALVLLSGGLDSTACLAWALQKYGLGAVSAVAFDYGQRHRREIKAARSIAGVCRVPISVVELEPFKETGLTGGPGDLEGQNIVVPDRNYKMLKRAALLPSLPDVLVFGACAADQSDFEDCRPAFFEATAKEMRCAIETPVIEMTKADVIAWFPQLGASSLLIYTWSCYAGDEKACGYCQACRARLQGFFEACKVDPCQYTDDALRVPCLRCLRGGLHTQPGERCHHPSHGWALPCYRRTQAVCCSEPAWRYEPSTDETDCVSCGETVWTQS